MARDGTISGQAQLQDLGITSDECLKLLPIAPVLRECLDEFARFYHANDGVRWRAERSLRLHAHEENALATALINLAFDVVVSKSSRIGPCLELPDGATLDAETFVEAVANREWHRCLLIRIGADICRRLYPTHQADTLHVELLCAIGHDNGLQLARERLNALAKPLAPLRQHLFESEFNEKKLLRRACEKYYPHISERPLTRPWEHQAYDIQRKLRPLGAEGKLSTLSERLDKITGNGYTTLNGDANIALICDDPYFIATPESASLIREPVRFEDVFKDAKICLRRSVGEKILGKYSILIGHSFVPNRVNDLTPYFPYDLLFSVIKLTGEKGAMTHVVLRGDSWPRKSWLIPIDVFTYASEIDLEYFGD
ncbi:MAG: hypothetical protein AB8G16_19610 [Gammaproteobacteria bacterium]